MILPHNLRKPKVSDITRHFQATRLDMPNCAFSGSLCLVCITAAIYQTALFSPGAAASYHG